MVNHYALNRQAGFSSSTNQKSTDTCGKFSNHGVRQMHRSFRNQRTISLRRAASTTRRCSNSCSRLLPANRAAASNAARASAKRPSLQSRSPRTLSQQMIVLQRRLACQSVHDRERGRRPLGHADRNRAVELDDRRAHQRRQFGVELRDARPLRFIGRARLWRDRRRSPPAARRTRRAPPSSCARASAASPRRI